MHLLKWVRPNTLIKKSFYQILMTGIVAVILVQVLLPSIFFRMLTPYMEQYVSGLLRANTISQSIVWRGNSMAFDLYWSEELKEDIAEYTKTKQENVRNTISEKIRDRLARYSLGEVSYQVPGEGAIVSTSYSMVCTENGDAFYLAESSDLAEVLMESGWLSELTLTDDMMYSPVLESRDGSVRIICFVMPFEAEGTLCMAIHIMDFTYIQTLFSELEESGIQDYALIQRDRILYQNTSFPFPLQEMSEAISTPLQYQTSFLRKDNGMYFVTLCSYEGEGMKIITYADRQTLLAPYLKLIHLIGGLISLLVILLFGFMWLILRHILGRLSVLSRRIDRVRERNYTPLPPDGHEDEIGTLTRNFNTMVEDIQKNIEEKVEQEKKTQQMQYSLMVSAVNPHFIYNTLNTITFLAHMGETKEIIQVNQALIGTLKDRLAIKNCRNFDSIAAEEEILEKYMLIQSYLCHNSIDYRFEVSEEDEALCIPKNILQPLTENAIKHGLLTHKDKDTHKLLDGQILISAKRRADELTITVSDNGSGIQEKDIKTFFEGSLQEEMKEVEHTGIYNIRIRLDYLMKDRYQLTAENLPEGGCRITLRFPLLASQGF